MKVGKKLAVVATGVVMAALLISAEVTAEIDWAHFDWSPLKKLQGQAFLDYFESLGLRGQDALDFFKYMPVSQANKGVYERFQREGFQFYLDKYPSQPTLGGYAFKIGMGTEIVGPMSGQQLKLLFTDYLPLPEGPVGDPNKTYRIGYTIHGFNHPWLLNNADTAIWEANRHPNVKLTVLDPEFDDAKQARHIDTWVAQGYDGIMIWPRVEAPIGPPVDRAQARGVPCISIDRMTGSEDITARVTGNFPANGAEQGVYLVHKLLQEIGKVEGTIVMVRKPLGGTADSMRTGHFLKVISYFPGLEIVANYHNNSDRPESFRQVQDALMAFPNVDCIFSTGGEQSMGAAEAVELAKAWHNRSGGRKLIILNNDDSRETLTAVREGKLTMTAPYTPLLGALGLRALLRIITGQEELPQDITTPDLPVITQEKEDVLHIPSVTVEEWWLYCYGPPLE